MGETFYTTLGVDADADTETIRCAYRELVKESHPDVSDAPDAQERFKRLTTARDVLLDENERSRYDRLGHDAYVRKHVTQSAWQVEDAQGGTTSSGTHASVAYQQSDWGTQSTTQGEHNRTRNDARERKATSTSQSRTDGGHTTQSWQHASDAYRRVDVDVDSTVESPLIAILKALGRLGPWIFVHVLLITSAAATLWFTYLASSALQLSVTAVVLTSILVPLVILLSLLHVLLRLYS